MTEQADGSYKLDVFKPDGQKVEGEINYSELYENCVRDIVV